MNVIALMIVVIYFMAYLLTQSFGLLACDQGGLESLYEGILRALFVLFHMMVKCFQGIVMEQVFYSIAHKLGYFHVQFLEIASLLLYICSLNKTSQVRAIA